MNKYIPVIGLEVHVELKTKSKMFCSCSAQYFGQKPNTHTCPVCLGLPGALPVPNKKAIRWCVAIGMALGCEIPMFAKFDRKNYFYPDLAKGYQISQYDEPFCVNGIIKLKSGKEIRIRRVHMEEDTGKLLHETASEKKVSLIDFNRSGVPLVEIVTEPDFDTPEEVVEYLQKLQQVVRYLDVSNADMEKGEMRLEPNISMQSEDEHNKSKLPKYKVEVKNINSFRFVKRAIEMEMARQMQLRNKGKTPIQETRGWNEFKNDTVYQRAKEEANDYRYFPEPDIPPTRWVAHELSALRDSLPELPDAKFERFKKEYSLPDYDAEILTRERETADYFEQAVKDGKRFRVLAKQIANYIINKKISIIDTVPAGLIELIKSSMQVLPVDEKKLNEIIEKAVTENKKAVEDFKNGKEPAIMFLVGQVIRNFKEKIDAKIVKQKLIDRLKE